jgi:hypothetical protein
MDLVRDVLDKKLVDRNGHEIGRVDDIVLTVRHGEPPRLAALETGPSVLAARVHPVLGRWMRAFEFGWNIAAGRPVRLSPRALLEMAMTIRVDVDFDDTGASTVERKLRRWIGSLPRSS